MAGAIKRVLPVLDYVLIQRTEPSQKTKGFYILNKVLSRKTPEGKVVAVGPGKRHHETGNLIPMQMKAGDRVLLPEYGGTRVEIADQRSEYLLFRESEIIAKIQ